MRSLHLLYGTESGNAEDLAKRTATTLKKEGFDVDLKDMADFEPSDVQNVRTLIIITSTFGNGDPPYNAEALHSFLMNDADKLDLRFCVLALGDTTYEHFAQCGKDFDRRLEELGGKRFADRVDCDVDYEEPYDKWMKAVLPALSTLTFDGVASAAAIPPPKPSQPSLGSRRNPLLAEVIENYDLHGAGSDKHTHHLTLSLANAPIEFELGDSFGIWPVNPPAQVEEILRRTGLDGTAQVEVGNSALTLAEALRTKLDIVQVDVRLLEHVGTALGVDADPASRQSYIKAHHLIDALRAVDHSWTPSLFASCLRPLAPRLYSVASSPKALPGVVQFMVAILEFPFREETRRGIFSAQALERCAPGTRLPVYVHPSPSFRLTDPDRPMIMIGPGTGLAPFRSFLQERSATGAKGRNWLFFGSRYRATDFLYEPELEGFSKNGVLTRLSTAFSRDQAHKIYVQDRIGEHAAELYRWISDGAAVYVCGDAKGMAPGVHAALLEVIQKEAGVDEAAAQERLSAMESARLYQRDVY